MIGISVWDPIRLSLQVMAMSVPMILLIGLGAALLLTRTRFPGQIVIETFIMLPLVLPPTVVGYALLRTLGTGSPLVEWFGFELLFTWPAAAVASTVVGIPLMVQATRISLQSIDPSIEDAARSQGSSELQLLWYITLPLARRGMLAGLMLGALRGLGEFGATLMVAGSIPGRTQTMPLAIYDAVLTRQFELANIFVALLGGLALIGLLLARYFGQQDTV